MHPVKSFVLALLLAAAPVLSAAAQTPATAPSFEELAGKLLPTVVNISTTTTIKAGDTQIPDFPQFPPGSPFENFFNDFYDRFRDTMPDGTAPQTSALGSGFIIDAQKGLIVTNNHVIRDADEIKVILHDDTTVDAELVGTDDKTDLAVLKIKTDKKLVAAQWGDSDTARVGSWVLAIGNPFGLGGSVTAGIVSARQRNINAGPYDDFIQTDASINRGNSGGPMFNTRGEVIGVNTAIFSPSGGSVGIGFAVPANIARNVVHQLATYGQTKRGWLGVRIQDITPDIAESIGLKAARGALVASVSDDSPAQKAGIRQGDAILSFDGKDITQMRRLPRIVADTEVGKTVPVKLWRKNTELTVNVTLGQLETAGTETAATATKPKTAPHPAGQTDIPALELSVATINDVLRQRFGLGKDARGLVVTDVKRGGVAAERFIVPGDIIIEVEQQEVKTPADINKKVAEVEKSGRTAVLLFLARKDDRRFAAVRIKK